MFEGYLIFTGKTMSCIKVVENIRGRVFLGEVSDEDTMRSSVPLLGLVCKMLII